MKVENKIIILSFIAGIFAGAADGILATLFFYEGSLLDILVFDVPRREVYVRSLILLTFVAFGMILSRDFARRRQAEKALSISNRMKGLFIDIMSHDLMNNVGIIKGVAEVMGDEELSEEARTELDMIEDAGRKLEEMIDGATSLSKLEVLEELSKSEMDLSSMTNEAIEELGHEAERKGMDVQFKFEGEAIAPTNPFMKDVFLNLISNAIKYSQDGGRVIVDLAEKDDSFMFKVADNGEGVSDECKESIFGRFTREAKKGVKGSGLGLAIVKRVVDMHDGKVWVEDSPKGGSIFYVEIPK